MFTRRWTHSSTPRRSIPSRERQRFRLEDINAVSPEDLARLSRFTVMAEALGSDTSSDATPLWNVLTDAGARLLFGSDWPSGPFDPRDTMESALNAPLDSPPADLATPAARSLRTIVDAYTSQAAFASLTNTAKASSRRECWPTS
jgi:predicted amidohydrolase YtcJ